MQYDFETVVSRRNAGSPKWDDMFRLNPDVGDSVVPLSVADMELKNPPEIIEGLKNYLDETILGYTMPTDSYMEAVCGWMSRRHDWHIEKEWILQWPGVVPAIYDIVREMVPPGQGVMIMTPVYYPFYSAVRNSGRRLVENPLLLTGTRYEIDFDDLETKAKDPDTKMLILCSPHNPVGRLWSKEELTRVAQICLDNDVLVVSDEIHFDIVMPGGKHTVFASISDEIAQNSIICTAPSKTFNLAGLQTSNVIISNDALRERIAKAHADSGFYMVNQLGTKACEIAYRECEDWLEQLLKLLEKNRDTAMEYLAKHIPAIKVIPAEATYLLWLDCRGLGMEAEELERFMQREAQLFLDEGYIFGDSGKGYERVNLACPTRVLLEALDRLRLALEKK